MTMDSQKIEKIKKHLKTPQGHLVLDAVIKLGLDVKVSESSASWDRDMVNVRDWDTNKLLVEISYHDIDNGNTEAILRTVCLELEEGA